jgi:Zinc carboxypeptidase
MLLALLGALTLSQKHLLDFYAYGPYDLTIPKPESILGYGPGEKHTNFRDQERVLSAIASTAKDRVRMFPYGVTPEGRPLRIFAISDPKNISRLESIRQEHAELAAGRGNANETIPIIWINECIHGDETASFEAAMWTFYTLTASRGPLAKTLENTVVVFNPVYNPDGHERYVVYNNSFAVGSSDPSAYEGFQPTIIHGRYNHYRFDMNRDRVAFSQDETRMEFAEMLKWNPQVYVDQHGQVSSYFFPPEPMSINPNVDRARNAKWTDIFGRSNAKAFDNHGFSYFIKDDYDLYYPGYLDASTTLTGAIGMTYETDGGRRLASERVDGSVLTLRRGVEKHFLSALTTIQATGENSKALLTDYAKYKRESVSGSFAGKFQRVVLTSPDVRPLLRLQSQLSFGGIKSDLVAPFKQDGTHDYWSDKVGETSFEGNVLVVDMAQPQGHFAKALLEPGGAFEPEFIKSQSGKKKTAPDGETYPGPEGSEFYDLTGWALPYAHNLKAWWCESAPHVQKIGSKPAESKTFARSPIGYVIPYSDQEDILAAIELLQAGLHVSVSNRVLHLRGGDVPKGSFLVLADRNDEEFEKVIESTLKNRVVAIRPLESAYPEEDRNSPGSSVNTPLKAPRIAVVMGTGSNMADSGATWYLFERVFHLPFTPIGTEALSRPNLNRFTSIIVPSDAVSSVSSELKSWLNAGGHLVCLDIPGWSVGSGGFVDLTEVKTPSQKLPGSIFRALADSRSPLVYGYEAREGEKIPIAVPVYGNQFFEARKAGGSVITFSDEEKGNRLLTGWEWPDETEKILRNTVFLQDSRVGQGHVVLFSQDPTERAMWPGLYKLLLNGILFGGY